MIHAYKTKWLGLPMSPELTLSHHQQRAFHPEKLSAPRDFNHSMQNISSTDANVSHNPLVLEIGAGKGKHALLFASQNPDTQLVAIERTRNKFVAFTKLAVQQKLMNLIPVHADAIAWIVHAIKPNSVACIYILYPNPEPHNPNQQWLNMPFFEFLLSRLQVGGTITLASNIAEYIAEAEQQLINIWKLPFVKEVINSTSARTHFEIKYLERGELCQQLIITKPTDYSTRFDDFMPLQGQVVVESIPLQTDLNRGQ